MGVGIGGGDGGATLVYADDNRWSNCTTTNCSSSRPIRIETRSENWNARRRVTWFWNRKSHTRRPIGNNGCQWRIYTLEMRSRKRQMQMRFSPLNSVSATYNDLGKYFSFYYKKLSRVHTLCVLYETFSNFFDAVTRFECRDRIGK